jgi:hypothetical protein
MVWIVILVVIILLFLWILLAPVIIWIDTRVPVIDMRLKSIGGASIRMEESEFCLRVEVFFFHFYRRFKDLGGKKREGKSSVHKNEKKSRPNILPHVLRMIKSCKVREFELSICPDDYTLTAKLYPLNFIALPAFRNISIHFRGENYLLTKITTAPWRIAYAWIRK